MDASTMPAPNYVRRALAQFAGYGDVEALVATDGRRFTFTDLRTRIRNTAAALWHHGIRPGTTVGILVTNAADSFFVVMGAHLLGARTVMMQSSPPKPVLRAVFGFTKIETFIYEAPKLDELGRDLAQAAGLGQGPSAVLCIGAGGLGPDLTNPPDVTRMPFDPDAVTVGPESLFTTSGTTGTPKLLRHGDRFFATVPKVAQFYRPSDSRRIRHLSSSGCWHSAGQSAALMTWLSGGLYYMLNEFTVEQYNEVIAKEQITSLHITPSDLYRWLDSGQLGTADLSSLYSATICCSPARPVRLKEAASWFGPALNVVYGMSEIPMITVMPDIGDPRHPQRLASCGRPWADNRIEIRNGAAVLAAGEVGEIWVTGEFLTEGYWNAPELNSQNLVDGWLRTGDVGRLDEDGYLYIVDRVTDMILTHEGGLMIYCRPLEDALVEHPQVLQAAVIGVPDEFLGERIRAYVIRTPGATVTAEELRQFVVDQLSRAWSPHEVEFVDMLPTNDYGKVDKKLLRARYLSGRATPAPP